MRCPTCDREMPKPALLDATGRQFGINNVLLLMVPVGVSNGYRPVVVIPDSIEAEDGKWTLYGREYEPQHPRMIEGIVGERHPMLYKLDTMQSLL